MNHRKQIKDPYSKFITIFFSLFNSLKHNPGIAEEITIMKRVIGKMHPTDLAPSSKKERKEGDTKALMELEKIFSAGSSIDAIKIFYRAKKGIWSSTQTIRELDLTQKRYYTHLKRLMEADLVQKLDGAYQHTMLGSICYIFSEALLSTLVQRDRLSLISKLAEARTITTKEKKDLLNVLLKNVEPAVSGLIANLAIDKTEA